MRSTHTYTILEVSAEAYEEIRALLEAAGYHHAFHDDVIDMHGIALQCVTAHIGSPVHTLNEVSTLLASYKPEHPGEHSSKPAEVAELLRKHCAGPFLELFGRGPRDGWTVWGAEVDKFAAEAA